VEPSKVLEPMLNALLTLVAVAAFPVISLAKLLPVAFGIPFSK
jgi:hypothetical protein